MPGILFPKNEKGERSTTSFQRDLFKSMATKLTDADDLAQGILSEKDWRHRYDHWLTLLLEAQVRATGSEQGKKLALDSLSCGLECSKALEFERPDGSVVSLKEEMSGDDATLGQVVIKGTGAMSAEYVVPYKGVDLQGADLAAQLQAWANYGTIEADCASAIQDASGKVAQMQGKSFVVLGAGSELGPLQKLLCAGATVYAVGTKKPSNWARLIEFAKTTAGTLVVPVPTGTPASTDPSEVAGADLLNSPRAVKTWVLSCLKTAAGQVTIGTYLYADSDANVRLTAAADYIIAAAAKLGQDRVSFAWLGSPATAHIIPAECVQAQAQNIEKMSWWQKLMPFSSSQREPVDVGSDKAYIFKGYAIMQGPNYALAQHMRHWRAMLLHEAGFTVSTPMAPSCRTDSVCHNATMAKVLDGMAYFPPCEAFDADTAKALLFGMLVSDLTGTKPAPLPSCFHLFTQKSCHGGLWRTPYTLESCGKTTFLLGQLAPRKHN